VHGGGQELRADVHGTTARLSGTVTAHTKLRVSLVPLTEGEQTEETGAAAAFPPGW
jgi:hypothetical protein